MRILRRRVWKYRPLDDSLSDAAVRAGSWFDFSDTPETSFEPHDYAGGAGLFLDAKPLGRIDEPESHGRKRVETWIELLPSLTEVRQLWLFCHVPKRLFEAACRLPNLETLYVKWGNADGLSPLSNLEHLRHVHLGSMTKVTDVNPLGTMTQLISLEIENFKGVTDFGPLANLTTLEGLALDGSIWTEQKIESLEPIGQMSGLRTFSMINARLRTRSFDPLLKLEQLEHFRWHDWFPDSEFEKLKDLPKLKYGNLFDT